MRLTEREHYEVTDEVAEEGDPRLLFGPLRPWPPDLPQAWASVLQSEDWRNALLELWRPFERLLPRVFRALEERLQGVALLCTDEEPASLLYFFSDGKSYVCYRGRPPLPIDYDHLFPLPEHFLVFSRLHDGWYAHSTRDQGPLPSSHWVPPDLVWEDFEIETPSGEISADDLKVVYRQGDDILFAYDSAHLEAPPVVIQSDGTLEVVTDLWAAIDREIGDFLEQMQIVSPLQLTRAPLVREEPRPPETHTAAPFASTEFNPLSLSVSASNREKFECALDEGWFQARRSPGSTMLNDFHRQALAAWCASMEDEGITSAAEVSWMFSLALVLGETESAYFIATMPSAIWGDGSLAAWHTDLLIALFLADGTRVQAASEEVLGLTFDADTPPSIESEIMARLFEGLTRRGRRSYADARQRALDELCGPTSEAVARFPWRIRLGAFELLATRLGLVD